MSSIPKRLHASLGVALAAAVVFAGAFSPAVAETMPSAAQVIAIAARADGKTPFKGVRSQQVIRQDMVLHANARIDFKSPQTYQIALTSPKEIDGLNLVLDNNKMTAYFPKETLVFQSDLAAGSEEIKDLIMGRLTEDPAALSRNYKISVAPELDVVALYPCYKLTLVPTKGLGAMSPPGHRIWVNKENGQIMKEERFWSDDMASYFISQYDSFSTAEPPTVKLVIPREANKLKLVAGTPTAMTRFASVEAARAAGKDVFAPATVPDGFRLRAVDVMTLYGTDIVLLRYNDGLSNLVVTYRAKPNAFLTLMAGAFALSLVEKISALSYHAPNNYAVVERGDNYVYAYGDLWVDTLKSIAGSVPIPGKPQQGAQPAPSASR